MNFLSYCWTSYEKWEDWGIRRETENFLTFCDLWGWGCEGQVSDSSPRGTPLSNDSLLPYESGRKGRENELDCGAKTIVFSLSNSVEPTLITFMFAAERPCMSCSISSPGKRNKWREYGVQCSHLGTVLWIAASLVAASRMQTVMNEVSGGAYSWTNFSDLFFSSGLWRCRG